MMAQGSSVSVRNNNQGAAGQVWSITNSLDILRDRLLRQIARNRNKKPVRSINLVSLEHIANPCFRMLRQLVLLMMREILCPLEDESFILIMSLPDEIF